MLGHAHRKTILDPICIVPPDSAKLSHGRIVFGYAWNRQVFPGTEQVGKVPKHVSIDPNMYRRFVALEKGPAKEVVNFAQRYGPLLLKDSRLPESQPVDLYRAWSRRGAAILRAGLALQNNEPWRTADYREIVAYLGDNEGLQELVLMSGQLLDGDQERDHDRGNQYIKAAKSSPNGVFRDAVNKWYDACPSHRLIEVVNEELVIAPRVGSVLGTIIQQISEAVAFRQLASCSGCGIIYESKRKPRADCRHYCLNCRRKQVPHRQAVRDHRKRALAN